MEEKSLRNKLLEEPYRFEFFQAVRLLEKTKPDRKPVGGDALPGEEVVRFRSRLGLDFPASEIHEIKVAGDGATDGPDAEMFVNFMGMVGVSGVLPVAYTELAMERARYRDATLWKFLDIFTHRAVSLFFRAWEKYRFPVQYERGNDDFTQHLFDIVGLGTKGLRGRMDLPDESLLAYSGLIGQRPHSVTALENLLSDYFGVRVKVLQFFGQWLRLDASGTTALGERNSVLGRTALLGDRIWDTQSKFRVVLGPMKLERFQGFLPDGDASPPLRSLIRFFAGPEFDFDLRLILEAKEVPGTVLTTRARRKPKLGWTSFLKTRPLGRDDDQLILQQAG
jgi:type VI secretion system protein ImpH